MWVKIAEQFYNEETALGLCGLENSGTEVMRGVSYTDDSPVSLFRPREDCGGYFMPTIGDDGYAYRRSEQRAWIALFIAAMCETGDAYGSAPRVPQEDGK